VTKGPGAYAGGFFSPRGKYCRDRCGNSNGQNNSFPTRSGGFFIAQESIYFEVVDNLVKYKWALYGTRNYQTDIRRAMEKIQND